MVHCPGATPHLACVRHNPRPLRDPPRHADRHRTEPTRNRASRGHRFHGQSEINIPNPESYEALLREQYVIADHNERKASQTVGQGWTRPHARCMRRLPSCGH